MLPSGQPHVPEPAAALKLGEQSCGTVATTVGDYDLLFVHSTRVATEAREREDIPKGTELNQPPYLHRASRTCPLPQSEIRLGLWTPRPEFEFQGSLPGYETPAA